MGSARGDPLDDDDYPARGAPNDDCDDHPNPRLGWLDHQRPRVIDRPVPELGKCGS